MSRHRKLQSNQEPRLRTSDTGLISVMPTRIVQSLILNVCCLDPIIRNSVLSSFIFNLSWYIHFLKSLIQASLHGTHGLSLICWIIRIEWNCRAECHQRNSGHRARGLVLSRRAWRHKPRREGDLVSSPAEHRSAEKKLSDVTPSNKMRWLRPDKYDENHSRAFPRIPKLVVKRLSKICVKRSV